MIEHEDIGLMKQDIIDIINRRIGRFKDRLDQWRHVLQREIEDLGAIQVQARLAIQFFRAFRAVRFFQRQQWMLQTTGFDHDVRRAGTIGAKDTIHFIRLRINFQRRGRTCVAEQRDGSTVAFQKLGCGDIAGQNQGPRRTAGNLQGLHQRSRRPQAVGIAGATEIDIEGETGAQAQARLQGAGRGRNDEISALCHHDQHIDRVTRPAQFIEQPVSSFLAQVGGQYIRAGDMARTDTDRTHQAFAFGFFRDQVFGGQISRLGRYAGANAADTDALHCRFGHVRHLKLRHAYR